MKQATLRRSFAFAGAGLHTGAHGEVEVRPAPPDTGIVFVLRTAGGESVRVPATSEHVLDTSLATVIGANGATVATIEHLLSALLGMGVDNAEIAVRGPEIPIVEGSAKSFCDAISEIGLDVSGVSRREFTVDRPYELRDGDKAVVVLPSGEFRVRFVAEYDEPIGTHYFNAAIDARTYGNEIAPARTFTFLRDVEAMRARGLALGGSLDNAVVFDETGPMQALRWPNETARHKALDLIGDLALLGAWPRCEFIAIKSGHAMHARATRELRERLGIAAGTV